MFEITHSPEGDEARAGVLSTAHGLVHTPAFMPVATKATVKTLTSEDLRELDVEAVISNGYLLSLRPGVEAIEKLGGLHRFMSWDRTLFTDSGGFQVLNPEEWGGG